LIAREEHSISSGEQGKRKTTRASARLAENYVADYRARFFESSATELAPVILSTL
jgi:hypothetical protein